LVQRLNVAQQNVAQQNVAKQNVASKNVTRQNVTCPNVAYGIYIYIKHHFRRFRPIFSKKIAMFLKTNAMINFGHKAVVPGAKPTIVSCNDIAVKIYTIPRIA
jgi:hypothetical protein